MTKNFLHGLERCQVPPLERYHALLLTTEQLKMQEYLSSHCTQLSPLPMKSTANSTE